MNRLPSGKSSQRLDEAGFSMLEAVVAIGILAAALLPLLDFQMAVADGARRLEEHQKRMELEARAVAYLRSVSPVSLAEGEAELGDARLTWKVIDSAEPKRMISEQGAAGRFEVEVVRLKYELESRSFGAGGGVMVRLTWRAVTPFFDQ